MSNSIKKEQHPSPWLIAGRVVFTLALIGCIAFIFSNSMKIASVSTVSSGRVLTLLQAVLRRLGGVLTAMADETIQIYSPGRSSQVTDVWLDSAGVLAGILIALVFMALCRMLFHRCNKE